MDILSFLDTLEEPVSEDLEEELERRYEQAKWGYVDGFGETVMDKEQFTRIARHFAQWGAEHYRDSTKKMSKDLEEAADEYSGDSNTGFIDMTSYRAFIAGAEWMKKQIPMPEDTVIFQKGVEEGKRLMMEDAVEGTVIELGETYKDLSLSVNAKELNQVLQPLGVGDGNKVKIIIVKEEEQ